MTPTTVHATATSLSWIPSEAVTGMSRKAFDLGFTHYDEPPPDTIDDLDELRAHDRFRYANVLACWAAVEDGRVVRAGYDDDAGVMMGSTTIHIGKLGTTFTAVAFPVIRRDPELLEDGSARLVQTCGGRTGLPAPRPVPHPPFVKMQAPWVWTTLALTVRPDGSSEVELTGASRFPRHWVYDAAGMLVLKSGLTDFSSWYAHSFGSRTPWGDEDSPALVTAAESAGERAMSRLLMSGAQRPRIATLAAGDLLTRQGTPGDELYLLLDGVLAVDVDGDRLAEIGPGAILGERAVLEGGLRTSTLTAVTPARVAVAAADAIDHERLAELAATHRREDRAATPAATVGGTTAGGTAGSAPTGVAAGGAGSASHQPTGRTPAEVEST
ncbi:cyclic nucleotide-binding domain-containing protein [Phytoactinopolyspora halotolerans]|uniref:Cyclic nucleotide-binding domain-containing protein n=1 Tax=Phytoactinopolyspora halotolerans TaxID=1981512 RepID=A0A6L9S4K9_9ACTN|nr:cyclic nucleotide-binding domain-containing protein [Phytoactinopolyspora halotolerans]NED99936.1 cyclic nucleotide-binding domain-containing protein [Phytoactinopolyspora halotolerans]